MAPPKEASASAGPALVKMIVARGRTVQAGGLRYEKFQPPGAKDPISVPVPIEGKFVFKAGETIELEPAEAKRLHAMGYVVKANEPQTRPAMTLAPADGPSVTENEEE